MRFPLSLLGALAVIVPALAADPPKFDFPDPLVMKDGTKVTTKDDWTKKRKPELMELFQKEMYGRYPKVKVTPSTKVLFEDAQSLRGRVGLKLGATLDVEGTAVRPYAEVSALREFLGETEATVGDSVFASELEGNAVEVGLGVSVTDKTGHLSLFVDGDYVQGDVGSSVQVQGGIRVSW